ncbi:hypothetical protein [Conexibacter sp. CPCC 206217]|uniref:restriction endonuclease subunit S n=1 Tax=Conexibacter sp. CPCC 206217 TaxID=3064574 RepID=UPI00271B24D4|nr:hypothetical protein [Conexibacter sp. CPCC 206217]MDO8210967.1 hypothetical protein [Conexibacter sp. CPCC 206217]
MDFTPDERAVYALIDGDVLLTEASGSASQVGRPAIWRGDLPLCCFQNTVIRVRPHAADPEYVLLVFRHYMASGLFADAARGIGIQHLGGARLEQLPFPLPPLAEQRRIVAEATRRGDELRAAADSLETALARTHEQDSEVLSAAVAGRIVSADIAPSGLPAGWRLTSVRDAGEVRLGRQRSPASHSGPNMRPYLRVANVLEDRIDLSDVKEMNFTPEEAEIYALEPGDILLNEGQSLELVGRPAMYRGELPGVCFQNTLVRFRAIPEVDPEFALIVFLHYLRSGEFRRIARGSTNIAHLSRTRFVEMPFPVAPLDEQRAIANEARRFLDESRVRREMLVRSLDRIAQVEKEVLAAAVSGALVPQNEGDEHAEDLLKRCGPPPLDRRAIDNRAVEEGNMAKQPDSEPRRLGEPELAAALRRSGPMRIPELCRSAGFDLNDVGEIERFYLALRNELGVSVEAVGEREENQTLGAVPDAP